MKFGVQLYGPLNNMQGEVLEKLSALAKAGITEIEPCMTTGPILGPEGVIWPADWLLAHVEEIRDMGLRIVSIHVFAENLVQSMDKLKAIAEKTGLKQFVVKTPENSTESILQQTALNYMKAADMLETFGVRLLLHNEAGDIQTKIAGKTAYEHLLDLCMGKVGAQVDVGWVQFGGEDPVAFWSATRRGCSPCTTRISVRVASRSTCRWARATWTLPRASVLPRVGTFRSLSIRSTLVPMCRANFKKFVRC